MDPFAEQKNWKQRIRSHYFFAQTQMALAKYLQQLSVRLRIHGVSGLGAARCHIITKLTPGWIQKYFEIWFYEVFLPHIRRNTSEKVALILDNARSHDEKTRKS